MHNNRPNTKGPRKQYQQNGHWIVKPSKTEILLCACGNKYIKTRPGQGACLRCTYKR